MKKTYTIIVHKENNIYWGECPELQGCFAQAKSVEQLKKLMMESIYKIYCKISIYKCKRCKILISIL